MDVVCLLLLRIGAVSCFIQIILEGERIAFLNSSMSTEIFGGKNRTPTPGLDDCHALATTDYMDLLWTTLAEFPGIFATIYIIERCGRKKTMAFQFLLYAGCVSLITITEE